jgi:hypothetical protein
MGLNEELDRDRAAVSVTPPAGLSPAFPTYIVSKRRWEYRDWGNARNDAADYGRLANLLDPELELRPARPVGRKPPHIPGQLSLWGGRAPA